MNKSIKLALEIAEKVKYNYSCILFKGIILDYDIILTHTKETWESLKNAFDKLNIDYICCDESNCNEGYTIVLM